MFINSKKITEEFLITQGIAPAASAAVSSSALVAMTQYTKFLTTVSVGALTTASDVVVTVYESTASAWASAVATEVTAARTTTSVATSGTAIIQVEVDGDSLNKAYVGVRVTKADTAAAISAVISRAGARYGNM